MPEIISRLLYILLAIFQLSSSDRRIKGGQDITFDKRYAVYLLKPPDAPVKVPGWTCGGAIVSPSFVVTAAACVNDLQRIYVIAGYKKFVTSSEINEDKCTSKMKKKVIYTCLPKAYDLNYHSTEGWARVDIAVVKVDTPFNFTDNAYTTHCSYIPTTIEVNYWSRYQEPGIDALTMGWGHLGQHKDDLDVKNYNVDTIKYTPTKVLEKDKCLTYFPNNKRMHPIIKDYMICTLDSGNLDDGGHLILRSPTHLKGCIAKKDLRMGMIGRTCEGEESEILETSAEHNGSIRLGDEINNQMNVPLKDANMDNETLRALNHNIQRARDAPGICQNDHGGPIVTWEGRHEILIGVATLYKVDDESNCIGPYLFTSTFCAAAFLQCILSLDDENDSGRKCQKPEAQKLGLVRRRISWDDKNARVTKEMVIVKQRPQVPISAFYAKLMKRFL